VEMLISPAGVEDPLPQAAREAAASTPAVNQTADRPARADRARDCSARGRAG
jgi:hypothetical protein